MRPRAAGSTHIPRFSAHRPHANSRPCRQGLEDCGPLSRPSSRAPTTSSRARVQDRIGMCVTSWGVGGEVRPHNALLRPGLLADHPCSSVPVVPRTQPPAGWQGPGQEETAAGLEGLQRPGRGPAAASSRRGSRAHLGRVGARCLGGEHWRGGLSPW